MGSFADYWEGEILDHLFDIGAYAAPTIWVGASTADPLDDASGLAEPVGGSYARVEVAAWSRAGNEVDNDAEIAFPEATGDWGTITHFALFDADVAGNMLGHGSLTAPKVIDTGDTIKFPAGDCNITLD